MFLLPLVSRLKYVLFWLFSHRRSLDHFYRACGHAVVGYRPRDDINDNIATGRQCPTLSAADININYKDIG